MVASWALLAPGMAPVLNPAPAGLPAAPKGAAAPLTVEHAALGGAVIGAVGGVGIGMLMMGIKSTADALGQPILGSLGAVLCGIAAGAAGGAVIATQYSISVGPGGITVAPGPLPSKKEG
jgi:hypothetical protein